MKYLGIITIITLALIKCSTAPSNKMEVSAEREKPTNTKNNSETFDTTQLVKTGEMLDEDLFWEIIDKSLKNTSGQDAQEQFLIQEIKQLSPTQIVGFRLRTDKLLYDTYNSEIWCAGHLMNGGCSDDGFEYFRNWVISRGKKAYYQAIKNPDNLITEVDKDIEIYEFENFWYVALEAFSQKTGRNLYDYIDNENFNTREGQYPALMFDWEEENPESMKKICPKLYAKFAAGK